MMASSGSVICFAFAEPVERRKVFKAMRGKPDVEVVWPSDLVHWDCRSAVYIGNAAGPPIMRLRDAISLLRGIPENILATATVMCEDPAFGKQYLLEDDIKRAIVLFNLEEEQAPRLPP